MYLNISLDEKEEGENNFIEINDVNIYFGIDGDGYSDLRVILNECSEIPRKFSLFLR